MDMNLDPNTMKYMIRAKISADGVVEKPDVVGAIFGQTEGLLGEELDLRDLQKSSRIGRIEVDITATKGHAEGEVLIPSSLDQVETAILAASLETIDRVGPCRAKIDVLAIEDVRMTKRTRIVGRAKELLTRLLETSKSTSDDLTEAVRQSVQVQDILSYGPDRLPAGPNIEDSDAIIIVEGRNDVINLLKAGIKNAIAVEGTNVPKTIQDLSKERVVTAFVDGDRGGELILKELMQVAEVDFISRAPQNMEVEQLTHKQITKCLRNKVPAEQGADIITKAPTPDREDRAEIDGRSGRHDSDHRERRREDRDGQRDERKPRRDDNRREEPRKEEPRREEPQRVAKPKKQLTEEQEALSKTLFELSGSSKAKLVGPDNALLEEVAVRDLAERLKLEPAEKIKTVVFDGIVTQRLVDLAAEKKIASLVGSKMGNVTKQAVEVTIWTKADFE
jgi:DNA primase